MNIFSHKLPDKGTSSGDAISIISCVLGGSKYLKVLVSGANIIYFPIYELSVSGPLKKKQYMPVTNSLDILHYTVRVAENPYVPAAGVFGGWAVVCIGGAFLVKGWW